MVAVFFIVTALLLLSATASSVAKQPALLSQYKFSVFPKGVVTSLYSNVNLYAINNNDIVVGLNNTSGEWFIARPPYTEASITTIIINNTLTSIAVAGINSKDEVFGTVFASPSLGFLRRPNGHVDYFKAPTNYSIINLNDVNDQGMAVGTYNSLATPVQSLPFILDTNTGSFKKLDVGISTNFITPSAITNIGNIAGTFTSNPSIAKNFGFFYDGSRTIKFSYPGQKITAVNGMNDFNYLVGYYSTFPSFGYIGQVLGSTVQFTSVPAGVAVYGINDAGVVVGYNQSTRNPIPLIGKLAYSV